MSADHMITEFCNRERDRSFQLVQRGARKTTRSGPPETATSNRFAQLPVEPEVEDQEDGQEEMEEVIAVPPSR